MDKKKEHVMDWPTKTLIKMIQKDRFPRGLVKKVQFMLRNKGATKPPKKV